MRGSLHNIDQQISPSTEHPPPHPLSMDEGGEGGEVLPQGVNNKDFRKNPFTLVKKKQLKQITPKNYLKEEIDPADAEPKSKQYMKLSIFMLLCFTYTVHG